MRTVFAVALRIAASTRGGPRGGPYRIWDTHGTQSMGEEFSVVVRRRLRFSLIHATTHGALT